MEQSPTVYNLLVTGVFLTAAWFFYRAMFIGRRLAGQGVDARALDEKMSNLTGVLCTMGLGLVLVILGSLASNNHLALSTRSIVHYVAVGIFAVSYVLLRTAYTGEKRQPVHRWLTYVCGVSFAIGLGTGLAQLWFP